MKTAEIIEAISDITGGIQDAILEPNRMENILFEANYSYTTQANEQSEKGINDILEDMGYTISDCIIDTGKIIASVGQDQDDVLKSFKDLYIEANEEMSISTLINNSPFSTLDYENIKSINTKIDSSVKECKRNNLTSELRKTFENGEYKTVETTEDITLYRVYGGASKKEGRFLTTEKPTDRLYNKVASALLPQWKNSRQYYCEVLVPKGTILDIGKAAQQKLPNGEWLKGGGEQVLLPEEFVKYSSNYGQEHKLDFVNNYLEFSDKARGIEENNE